LGAHDFVAPERIAQSGTLNEIDLVPQQSCQFLLYANKVEQRVWSIRLKLHQDIDIAVRAKVVTQDRAEQRKRMDLI